MGEQFCHEEERRALSKSKPTSNASTNTNNPLKNATADASTGVDNLGLERTRWSDLYDPSEFSPGELFPEGELEPSE